MAASRRGSEEVDNRCPHPSYLPSPSGRGKVGGVRTGAIIAIFGLSACAPSAPVPTRTAHPVRVASLNLCTDQLVLALLPPGRIASVTPLARDPDQSLMAAAATTVAVNHGTAEEIVRQRPDLVVAGSFTTPATRALLKRLGYPLVEVDSPDDWAGIRRVTRQVAAAVGEPARGEAMIAHMDARLAALARDPAPPVRVAAWDGAGFGARRGSLYDAVLTAAGAINVATRPPVSGYGGGNAELLLAGDPALLVVGQRGGVRPGWRDAVAHHPVVRRHWAGRTVSISPAYYSCPTPFAVAAATRLRAQLRRSAERRT